MLLSEDDVDASSLLFPELLSALVVVVAVGADILVSLTIPASVMKVIGLISFGEDDDDSRSKPNTYCETTSNTGRIRKAIVFPQPKAGTPSFL